MSLVLRSMRIPFSRRGWTRYAPATHWLEATFKHQAWSRRAFLPRGGDHPVPYGETSVEEGPESYPSRIALRGMRLLLQSNGGSVGCPMHLAHGAPRIHAHNPEPCHGTLRHMVRRDAANYPTPEGVGKPISRCVFPADTSPVPASIGVPGSMPQVRLGDLRARAGRQESVGRQHLAQRTASMRAPRSSEACSIDREATRWPSRSCRSKGNTDGAGTEARRRHRRGRGRSSRARGSAEHERPVCAAIVAARWLV